jgi:1,4-dihydroxy-2-naphthoate polyprenyltransferase
MTAESVKPASPVPDDFAGDSVARVAKRLLHATRPKFFPASILPVIVGTAWGAGTAGQFDTPVFLLALLATLCVHAGCNVLNDVGDEVGGTDRQNNQRIYPYTGGSRFIQTGIMETRAMATWGTALLGIAAVAGMALLLLKGPLVLTFGLIGIALGVMYSLGPMPLSALGLGETAVGFAFGLLPVMGAAWLQSGVVEFNALLIALPVSAWVAAILLINEVPDIAADGATGKRTLPVRLGRRSTSAVYLSLHTGAAALVLVMAVQGLLPLLAPLVPFGLLALAAQGGRSIRRGTEDVTGLRRGIEATLAIHTLGTIWLTGCIVYAAYRAA